MAQVKAPWTPEQVKGLEKWQKNPRFHPFTCYNGHVLIPTLDGWVCPKCPAYHQDWAHDFMLTGGDTKWPRD